MMDDVKDYPPYLDYPKERKKQTNADRIRQVTKEEITGAIAVLERLQERYIKYESENPGRETAACILAGALDVAITVMKQEVQRCVIMRSWWID